MSVYREDRGLGHVLQPNIRREVRWLGRDIVVKTDQYGRRVPDTACGDETGTPIIVFAGDSYVFGNEVQAEETFVCRTGQVLGLRSVNLGVIGYSFGQACDSLKRYFAENREVAIFHAFIVLYVGNDLKYGAYPPSRPVVDADGYLVTPSARTFGIGAWLRKTLLLHSHVAFLAHRGYVAFRQRMASTQDAAPLGDLSIYREDFYGRAILTSHRQALNEIHLEALHHRVPMTVVLMPEKGQVYGHWGDLPNRKMAELLDTVGVPYLDLLPRLQAYSGRSQALYHDATDGHLSPHGHEAVSRALVEYLRSMHP